MAEVAAAVAALNFNSVHAGRVIIGQLDVFIAFDIVKAGPATTRIELCLGVEQLHATGYTDVSSLLFIIEKLAREWWLGGLACRFHRLIFLIELIQAEPLICKVDDQSCDDEVDQHKYKCSPLEFSRIAADSQREYRSR